MPWSKDDYPASMKGLEPQVRDKAIEIANALLEDGYAEGRAIRIAQSQAQKTEAGEPGPSEPPQHVVPRGDGWAIYKEGSQVATRTFDTREDAERRAKELAEKQNTDLVIHDEAGSETEHRNYT